MEPRNSTVKQEMEAIFSAPATPAPVSQSPEVSVKTTQSYTITKATYGIGTFVKDVTNKVRDLVKETSSVRGDAAWMNRKFGDPAPEQLKVLRIEYLNSTGEPKTITVNEDDPIILV